MFLRKNMMIHAEMIVNVLFFDDSQNIKNLMLF